MADKGKTQQTITKITLALLLGGALVALVHVFTERRDWVIPPEAKTMKNPMAGSAKALQEARPIYKENCGQCHGDTGKGDGREAKSHSTLPPDFTEPGRIANQEDGVLFYKISEGKRPMPSFRKRLTDDQRWELVLLVRALAESGESAKATQNPHP
jgi:mono/diheme cytochrome c family protein